MHASTPHSITAPVKLASRPQRTTIPLNLLRTRHIALLAVALAACSSDAPRSIDPTATYDAYGDRFEPGVAVPAPAVFAEPDAYVGRKVVIEGVASGNCEDPACVAAITSSVGGKIQVFLHSKEGNVHHLPADISGRRIVASGTLDGGRGSSHAPAEASPTPMAHAPTLGTSLPSSSGTSARRTGGVSVPDTGGVSAPDTGGVSAPSTRDTPVQGTRETPVMSTRDRRIPASADTLRAGADSTFRFYATGFMVEKVRP